MLATSPSHVFIEYIQHIIHDVESSTGFNAEMKNNQIVKGARSKYNNMSVHLQWNKVYPRNTELLALKTQVTTLENNHGGTPIFMTTDCKKSKKTNKESHLNLTNLEGIKVFKWCGV
jgi:hypothetical protein